MAYIKVDINKLGQLESQLNRIPSVISSTASTVRSVRSGLDWDVACESNIDSTLRRIASDLEACKSRMQNTVRFVDSAVQQYNKVEYGSSDKISIGKVSNVKPATIKSKIDSPKENELDNRQKKATAWKWVVGGLCAVASIAVVVATGGAATPLVMGAVSAVSGAAMAATNHLADEYVEEGNLDNTDWSEFGKDVLVGGCVGWVTGIVGGGVSNAVTNKLGATALQSGLYSTNTAVRIGTNALIGSASEVTSGIVSRGTGAFIEGAVDGDVSLGEIANQAFNPTNILYDAAVGGATSGFAGRKETSFSDGMSKADANRYYEATGGFAAEMSEVDAARYIQRQSGNYNTYNTELVVSDSAFINQNAFDTGYGSINWNKHAPNGGVVDGSILPDQTIPKGTIITRYGDGSGTYVSPEGTTFAERALPYTENPMALHKYKVLKPIKNVTVSEVAPAFDQPGGGIQYQLPDNIYNLMFEKGALVEVN